jgi:hypothetical protein
MQRDIKKTLVLNLHPMRRILNLTYLPLNLTRIRLGYAIGEWGGFKALLKKTKSST